MTDKLVITKEQSGALDLFNSYDLLFIDFINPETEWVGAFKSLNNFTPEQFALLLCGWYTVEEPFKVGDWVVHGLAEKIFKADIGKVTKLVEDGLHADNGMGGYIGAFRKATPQEIAQEKERRRWKAIDREPGQIKPYDIVTHEYHKGLLEVVSVEGEHAFVSDNFAGSEKKVLKTFLTLDTPSEQRFGLEDV
ncbi:hypothetical protein [Halobacillus ihumii]|uniref:hypothetical protein n=1 Tax=Halobacillus ihumii TaxID=2686092 RepID=UPI0013D31CEE|nr:hypothetical protein [Halobacillus ihumii]